MIDLKWYVLENLKFKSKNNKRVKMKLIINGEDKVFEEGNSLKNIIASLQAEEKVMAAAVNMDIVKKDEWINYFPKENDKIELLQFVGGG